MELHAEVLGLGEVEREGALALVRGVGVSVRVKVPLTEAARLGEPKLEFVGGWDAVAAAETESALLADTEEATEAVVQGDADAPALELAAALALSSPLGEPTARVADTVPLRDPLVDAQAEMLTLREALELGGELRDARAETDGEDETYGESDNLADRDTELDVQGDGDAVGDGSGEPEARGERETLTLRDGEPEAREVGEVLRERDGELVADALAADDGDTLALPLGRPLALLLADSTGDTELVLEDAAEVVAVPDALVPREALCELLRVRAAVAETDAVTDTMREVAEVALMLALRRPVVEPLERMLAVDGGDRDAAPDLLALGLLLSLECSEALASAEREDDAEVDEEALSQMVEVGDKEADALLLDVCVVADEGDTEALLLELCDGMDRLAAALDVAETVGDAERVSAPLEESDEVEEARELATALAVGDADIDTENAPLLELVADCVAPLLETTTVDDTDADGETVPERERALLPRGDALAVMLKLGRAVAVLHLVAVAHALAVAVPHGGVVGEGLALRDGADNDAALEKDAAGEMLTLLQLVAEADTLAQRVPDGLPLGVEERDADMEALAQIDDEDDTFIEAVATVVRLGEYESTAVLVTLLRALTEGPLDALTPVVVGAALCDEDAKLDAERVIVALAHSLNVVLAESDAATLLDVLPKMLLDGRPVALMPENVCTALCDNDAEFDVESDIVALALPLALALAESDGATLPVELPTLLIEGPLDALTPE